MPLNSSRLPRQPRLFVLFAALSPLLCAGPVSGAELMQAGVVSGTGVQVRSVAIPEPGADEVRIRVRAASVNPVDWKLAARGSAEGHIAGRDLAGVIDALGPGVSGWKVGDAVIAVASSGSYAQYAVASVHAIAAKPARWSFNEAAGLPVVGETAWRAMVTVANVQRGQRVLVQGGAGGVGSMAVQIAHDRGAEVSATASASNAEFLRSLGAGEVIDYHSARFEERLHDVDVVLNTVDPDIGLRSMKVIRPGGILVSVVGVPPADACAAAHIRCAITGSVTGQMLPNLVELANAGKLHMSVERVLPLSDAAQAWELNRAGHTRGKIILQIGGGAGAARDNAG
jgi:NADPH:quinone reductase-like Zn-dependent oxidoreductase